MTLEELLKLQDRSIDLPVRSPRPVIAAPETIPPSSSPVLLEDNTGGVPSVRRLYPELYPTPSGIERVREAYESLAEPQPTQFDPMIKEAILNMPKRNKPGFWSKLAAGFVAAGDGIEEADKMLYAPYYRELDDWSRRMGAMDIGRKIDEESIRRGEDRAKSIISSGINLDTLEYNRNLGLERLDLAEREQNLRELRNAQIYETRVADLERKAREAEEKLDIARQNLELRANSSAALASLREAQLDAANARHALDIALRERALNEQKRLNDARVEAIKNAAGSAGLEFVEFINEDTGERAVTIRRRGEGAEAADLRDKAIRYLRDRRLPETEANIEHAIRTGRVK